MHGETVKKRQTM